jgi:5-formyltetrahydrofolate cyclo-ligase
MLSSAPSDPRRALRQRLCSARNAFIAGTPAAPSALAEHLSLVLAELQPTCLGLYWALQSEFNAAAACFGDMALASTTVALPYARRSPRHMEYRSWDRGEPALRDECGIPTSDGPPVLPDVVLVPCVGFTAAGYRLGYGGGYFDRWLAAHPHVTAVGIAWSVGELSEVELAAQPHDHPLTLIVTEQGVVGG